MKHAFISNFGRPDDLCCVNFQVDLFPGEIVNLCPGVAFPSKSIENSNCEW